MYYTTADTTTTNTWYYWNYNDLTTASIDWIMEPCYDYTWCSWQAPENVVIYDADRVREHEYQEQLKEQQRKQLEAKEKAEQLLLENLTEEQRKMYLKLKKFHVISSDGKRFEIVCEGRKWHNIFELDDKGKRRIEYCIYTKGGIPLEDNYLAQKLLLECNEKEFQRIANQTRLIG